ncbi:MAG: nucleotidyltransferase domain-containing protein [Nanoarchaeota archaeon]|nr:nucleotidyltransferase domain-containing protein [Nanoarchaeota archaeon]MBU4352601.1 nucleotidyltransferase domain-containing protein [Nanoarchaeota archaeon]
MEVEHSIICLLLKEPRKKFTIENIVKKISSKKAKHSRASIFRYCSKLLKQNILKSKDLGRTKQVTLNLNNDETLALIAYIEIINKNRFLKQLNPGLQEYFKKLYTNFKQIHEVHSIIIFGSYAKGKQRAESDIDLIFLIGKPHIIHTAEHIKITIKKTKDLITAITNDLEAYLGKIKLSPVIIELEDYKRGVKENKTDIVTESFKDHVIIKNPFRYWEAIADELA